MTPAMCLAVVVVSVAGVAGAGPSATSEDVPKLAGTLIALGALHIFLGTIVLRYLEQKAAVAWQLRVHFVVAFAAASALVIASHCTAGLAYMSLVSQAVLFLSAPEVALVVLGCLGVLAAGTASEPAMMTRSLLGWTSAAAFVVASSWLLVRQRRAQAEVERLAEDLARANERLRASAKDVEELATTKERNRIAREIHDGLGHYLTVVHVQLEAAEATLTSDPAKAERAVARARALTHDGLDEVRRSVALLRGTTPPPGSLVATLEKLAEECTAAGLPAALTVMGAPRELAEPRAYTLFRAAQEALTNARRHAHAPRVDLTLDYGDSARVVLRVEDEGVGGPNAGNGFGLLGIRERVELVGGALRIVTDRPKGFALEVEVPG